jgi:hypothetical protein
MLADTGQYAVNLLTNLLTGIGVTGMPQADGSQKAVEIHIFPEPMRGTGEGHRPWTYSRAAL